MSQPSPQLGVASGRIQLENARAIRDLSAEIARQGRHELLLFTRNLDASLYEQPPFLSAVRRLALSRTVLSVRVLVFDSRQAVQCAPQLLELARRLTSRIAIRRVSEDDQDRLDAFLVVDERGYIRRGLADAMEAIADFNDPLTARQLRNDFNQLWERSDPDNELRRLFL